MSTKATGVTVVLVVIMPPVTGYHLGLGVLDSGQILSPLSLYSWSLYVLLCFNPPTDGLWGPAVRMMGSSGRVATAMQCTELPESTAYEESEWRGQDAFIPCKSVGLPQCHRGSYSSAHSPSGLYGCLSVCLCHSSLLFWLVLCQFDTS